MRNTFSITSLLLAALCAATLHGQTTVVDFESSLSSGTLAPNSFANDGPTSNSNPLVANGVAFNNTFANFGAFSSWAGWSFSSVADSTTAGFGNQYAAAPGSGANGSQNYAVAFQDSFNGIFPTIDFGAAVENVQLDITNTTYALLAIRDGNDAAGFVREFGDSDGVPGNDGAEDLFRVQVEGFDIVGSSVGTLDFELADYRFANNDDDFVINQWTEWDLSSLGQVWSLEFSLESTDVGPFGSNTPSYFAADNLRFESAVAVPEPTSLNLCVLAAIAAVCRRRRG